MFSIQFSLTILVGLEILQNEDTTWSAQPETMWIVFARFICGIVLHVSLSAELRQGMNLMKYAVNHHWKFLDYRLAFLTGFLSVTISMLIEIATFYMLLFASLEFFEVLEKFAVVILIADFGTVFYDLEKD